MRNKWLTIFVIALVCLSYTAVVFAEDTGGNNRKGKYLYRKLYKACHERGEVDSVKPKLNPDAKTQAEWKQLFEDKNFTEFGCAEEWTQQSDDAILDILAYLHDHASDSPTPLKCK